MNHKVKKNKTLKGVFVLGCVTILLLSGCATTTGNLSKTNVQIDPYEDFNRSMFSFNEKLDEYVAEPMVKAYNWATPRLVQTGIGNFFSNLRDVNVVLNDMMQGKFLQGGEDTGRFLLNSTVGIGGLIDVATEVGLEKHEEDFDQTFAVWGIPQGPYFVLPVLGPTTGRGITGTIFDTAANPATYVGYPIQAISLLNERANAEDALKLMDEAALDRYAFMREAYLQRRNNLITDGKAMLTDDVMDTSEMTASAKTPPSEPKKPVENASKKRKKHKGK
jgi:phospholipid-binding lipoprotein MlaA